jgi:hypothetical protein
MKIWQQKLSEGRVFEPPNDVIDFHESGALEHFPEINEFFAVSLN